MSIKSKIVKLVYSLLPESIINKSTGVISYGKNNLLPNELISAIASSGTAANCAKKLKTFTEGDGFPKGVGSIKVNPNQTADELLSEVAFSQAIFKGFALNIIYRNDGEIGRVYYIEFEKIRKTSGDQLLYNKTVGTANFKKAEEIIYPPFEKERYTPEERLARINWEIEEYGYQIGEILYSYETNPYIADYPYPETIAGLDDIISDGSLSKLENRNITKGFRPTVIISTVGEMDNKNKNANGKTNAEQFDSNLKAFTGDDADTILHIEASTVEGLPKVEQFPLEEQLDGVDKSTDRVSRKVSRLFGVPPAIIGLTDAAVLGNSEAISNAITILNNSVLPDQNSISRAFKMIWPIPDWTIKSLTLIKFIRPEVLAKLSVDELRALADYPAVSSEGQSTVTLAEKIGVGGVTSLTGILIDPVLTSEQKIQAIIIIFGLSTEQATALVTGVSPPVIPPTT